MSAGQPIRGSSVNQAIDILKVAIPSDGGVWLNAPSKVAEFIEVVAKKIDELIPR